MSLYKFVGEKRIDIIENLSIRLTQPLQWNDPFEMRPFYFDDNRPEFVGELFSPEYIAILEIEKLINEYFVSLSLTTNPANLLMWAHYAENHRGFLIEFDETNDFFKDTRKILFKIPYSNIRPILSKQSVINLIQEIVTTLQKGDGVDLIDFQRLTTIFHKSIDWKEEHEWRLITLTNFSNNIDILKKTRSSYYSFGFDTPAINKIRSDYVALFDLPPESIKSITFGCNVNQNLRRKIYFLRESNRLFNHLKLYQALMDNKEYKLVTQEIKQEDIYTMHELKKKGIIS